MVGKAWPLALLVAFGFMLVVAVTTAHGARCPRACRILSPATQTWVCPMMPGGGVIVRRDACFILHWPEP